MAQLDLFRFPSRPWNTGRMVGPTPPQKPKHHLGHPSSAQIYHRLVGRPGGFCCSTGGRLNSQMSPSGRQNN